MSSNSQKKFNSDFKFETAEELMGEKGVKKSKWQSVKQICRYHKELQKEKQKNKMSEEQQMNSNHSQASLHASFLQHIVSTEKSVKSLQERDDFQLFESKELSVNNMRKKGFLFSISSISQATPQNSMNISFLDNQSQHCGQLQEANIECCQDKFSQIIQRNEKFKDSEKKILKDFKKKRQSTKISLPFQNKLSRSQSVTQPSNLLKSQTFNKQQQAKEQTPKLTKISNNEMQKTLIKIKLKIKSPKKEQFQKSLKPVNEDIQEDIIEFHCKKEPLQNLSPLIYVEDQGLLASSSQFLFSPFAQPPETPKKQKRIQQILQKSSQKRLVESIKQPISSTKKQFRELKSVVGVKKITNNGRLITFQVLDSRNKIVYLTNEELREANPQLLVNYYENWYSMGDHLQ